MKLSKLFYWRKSRNKDDQSEPKSKFSIEFYPLTGRYYPKYEDYYLRTQYGTGIMDLQESRYFMYADYGKTEQEADAIIAKFKEQRLKENVTTIKR